MTSTKQLSCTCGQVHLSVDQAPIISTQCHCNSCRAAATKLQSRPGAPPILEKNGGTHFVLYRKDRIRFSKGSEHLKEFRLTPHAKTRRVVAVCCNTPVFLEFHQGHWLSLYGCLWPKAELPPSQERTMTSDLADASVLDDSVPNHKRQSLTFFAKLLGAWIAMGFKSPKIAVNGTIDG